MGILTYVVDTRDNFKFLTGTEKDIYKIGKKLKNESETLTDREK
jgi:hypothetical protein